MGIAPNTELYLLKGVPLDSDYNNTINFTTEQKQRQFFTAAKRIIKHFYNSVDLVTKAMSYIQKDDGVLCVGLPVAQCFNCNYIAFKNSSHEGKWFYAFVTKVEYANEKACYIHYQIDVMQTWMFDYNLGMSFIERQHHPTDNIGANRVPENLECGDYVNAELHNFDLSKMCVALVTSVEIPVATWEEWLNEAYGWGDGVEYAQLASKRYTCGESPSGVYNSLYYYTGFTLKEDSDYFKKHADEYNIQKAKKVEVTEVNGNWVSKTVYEPLNLECIIKSITSGEIEGINEDIIVALYQYPAWLESSDTNLSSKSGVMGTRFTLPFTYMLRGYSPKNNKLLTYPYSFIRCSNNAGSTADYQFENFTNPSSTPTFVLYGTIVNPPCLLMYPKNYRGISDDYDSGIVLNSFPVCAYVGDAYGRWISENKNALAMSILTSVIGGAIAVGAGGLGLGVATTAMSAISAGAGVVGGVAGAVGTVGSKLAKMTDLMNTHPNVHGQIQCESLNCGMDRVKYTFYHMTIRPEFARIIDDYFTMYGYATNTVDIPNITSRPHWNYIKTINANILPTSTTCIPSNDLHRIRAVYDHGITFWHNGDEIGDYSFDNSPNATYTIEEET